MRSISPTRAIRIAPKAVPLARPVLAVLLALSGVVALGPAASAQEQESTDSTTKDLSDGTEIPQLGLEVLLADVSEIHPEVLAASRLGGSRISKLVEQLSLEYFRLDRAGQERVVAESELLALAIDLGSTSESLLEWRQMELDRDFDQQAANARLVEFAIEGFAAETESLSVEQSFGAPVTPIPYLYEQARLKLETEFATAVSEWQDATRSVEDLTRERDRLVDESVLVNDRVEQASTAEVEALASIAELTPRLESATVLAPVGDLGFPVIVLDAYYRAELSAESMYSSCDLSWNQLAGIGQVESKHGTYGGSAVSTTGEVLPHILGIVLDGSRSSAISDTDGGSLDGNSEWDRAVGPMQFIPGSWSLFAADGNEDGDYDPHNIYDAALAAAKHLCSRDSNLQQPGSFTSALLSYNQSPAYGIQVAGWARSYGSSLRLGDHYRPQPVPEVLAAAEVPTEEEIVDG